MFEKRVFDKITKEKVEEWYSKHVSPSFLRSVIKYAEKDGYEFNPDSGLLIRKPFPEETTNVLGYTALDIIFLRPTDFHSHKDIDEAAKELQSSNLV